MLQLAHRRSEAPVECTTQTRHPRDLVTRKLTSFVYLERLPVPHRERAEANVDRPGDSEPDDELELETKRVRELHHKLSHLSNFART